MKLLFPKIYIVKSYLYITFPTYIIINKLSWFEYNLSISILGIGVSIK